MSGFVCGISPLVNKIKEARFIAATKKKARLIAAPKKKPTPTSIVSLNDEEKRIGEVLSYPIMLSDRVRAAIEEAHWFKFECSEIGKHSDQLCDMLNAVRLSTSTSGQLYERPVRRIVSDVTRNLERAYTFVRKCKRRSVLHRVVTTVSAAEFGTVLLLLESSFADMKWLLSIFDYDGAANGVDLSFPPIACYDTNLIWVWKFIASLYTSQLSDKIESANILASLAKDNDRNKKIIVEEGGVAPLLKLLKENMSPEAQIASAVALYNLANSEERVRAIIDYLGVPVIVKVLSDSPMRVQICVANLVAMMAEHCALAQEDFARENVIRPLVTLLSFDIFIEDSKLKAGGKQSIQTLVHINKEMEKTSLGSSISSSNRVGNHRKDRENASSELKLQLKICCGKALWMLARGNISNSRQITETKGLLCLAKTLEREHRELQFNCLMAIMEITGAAESNPDLRRAAFKGNSRAAKAVVDQLLRIMNESDDPTFQLPAIRAIGSLARTFRASETRVIGPLVGHVSNNHLEVAEEAVVALMKFFSPENYLCTEHVKTMIDFNKVSTLMKPRRGHERSQLHSFLLLCHLACHAGDNAALERAGVRIALEGAGSLTSQHRELEELRQKALYHLNVFHSGPINFKHQVSTRGQW